MGGLPLSRRALLMGAAAVLFGARRWECELTGTSAFAELGERLPWVPLGRFPTRVEPLAQLGAELGVERLFVKRDDESGELYGGGKPRKLELLLGEAVSRGARRVVTSGGVGSNHALATALYARRLGLDVTLHLLPEPRAEHVRANLLAMVETGAEVKLGGTDAPPRKDAYPIAMGGSSALGTVGFVAAGFELARQVRDAELPEPDAIYAALGTGGSAVGLALGCAAAGLRSEVVAVRASSPGTSSATHLARLRRRVLALLRASAPAFPDGRLPRLEPHQLGRGYAHPTARSRAAVLLAARHHLPAVEPTYTAKTLAAVAADAERLRDRVVLLWLGANSRSLPQPSITLADVPRELREWAR